MTPEAAVSKRYILNEYVERAIEEAVYDKLENGTFRGRIPSCPRDRFLPDRLGDAKRNCALRSRIGFWSALNYIIHYRSLGISI
jgi:hypothetical protein